MKKIIIELCADRNFTTVAIWNGNKSKSLFIESADKVELRMLPERKEKEK